MGIIYALSASKFQSFCSYDHCFPAMENRDELNKSPAVYKSLTCKMNTFVSPFSTSDGFMCLCSSVTKLEMIVLFTIA